ncbi:hypothetical protein AMR72_02230 [Flavobacterium psychrophilum]|nr:hypothetical protein AMR72_02230 [Flavobacterium psychrophilum]AOE51443.1 hypothetical protein ALW18_02230 [Flavobacterium psychrophilum]
MKLTKQAINESLNQIEGIEGYYLLINNIEDNIEFHPDIAIEVCKSLIEGLCKKALELLSDEYNADKKLIKDCNHKLPTLSLTAFNHVFQEAFESKLYFGLYSLIANEVRLRTIIDSSKKKIYNNINDTLQQINRVRGDRGDLCHGRSYPKNIESSVYFANSIVSITDGICSYLIYNILENVSERTLQIKDDYPDLEEYNKWLDESIKDFPIVNERFSKILFMHDKDIYYNRYNDEFLTLSQLDDEIDTNSDFDNETFVISDKAHPTATDSQPEYSILSEEQIEAINQFSEEELVRAEELRELAENIINTKREVSRNDVFELMLYEPSLRERKRITEQLAEKINSFIKTLV